MAFRSANLTAHMIKFNSTASCELLDMYSKLVDDELVQKSEELKQQTFAPSQMRCDRVSWFRLRGVQPDKVTVPDKSLNFTAEIGTACHEIIQSRLQKKLGDDWIEVEDWIKSNPDLFSDYDMTITKAGYESRVEMRKPYPVRFGCDGILRFQNKVYLLEIKTTESFSLADLVEPKPKHMDQIKCYSTLLKIPNVLFLYEERQFGSQKCFEVTVTEDDWIATKQKMDNVLDCVQSNIAPDGLLVGDPDCTQNICPYFRKCKEWGR